VWLNLGSSCGSENTAVSSARGILRLFICSGRAAISGAVSIVSSDGKMIASATRGCIGQASFHNHFVDGVSFFSAAEGLKCGVTIGLWRNSTTGAQ
jgi:hypothetical protein